MPSGAILYRIILSFCGPQLPVTDKLEKLPASGRLLLRRLKIEKDRLLVEILQTVDLETICPEKIASGKIDLEGGQGELAPEDPLASAPMVQ